MFTLFSTASVIISSAVLLKTPIQQGHTDLGRKKPSLLVLFVNVIVIKGNGDNAHCIPQCKNNRVMYHTGRVL